MKATDMNRERNEKFRFFHQFNRESILIILVSICVVLSIASFLRAERAIDAANKANATATTWQTMYKETDRECRLAQNDIDDFRIALFKAGIKIEHTGETP